MNALDLNEERLRRLLVALEHLERWAEQSAAVSDADPSWRERRARAARDPDAQAALAVIEGAESAYADVAARIADLRARIEQAEDDGAPLQRFGRVLDALGGELDWCLGQEREARAAVGLEMELEERHALGRVEALDEAATELRALLEAAPRGTV